MAKETSTESILDDNEPLEHEDRQEQQEQEPPKDVRGAIRAALDEHRDDNDSNRSERNSDKGSVRTKTRSDADSNSDVDVSDDKKDGNKDTKSTKEKEESTEKPTSTEKGEKKEEVKLDPPPFFRNKGKAVWDKVGPEEKQIILAREKEISDGFAQVSQRFRAVEELERVIAPRLPIIQQLGATPVQAIDRMFQWMEALSGPNREKAFNDLAQSYGINLNQRQDDTTSMESDPASPPPWLAEFAGAVEKKFGTLEQHLATQQQAAHQAAAQNVVSAWAKDKPYYQQVAPLMGQILSAGIVGLKEDGSVDLDGAYERAIKLDPNVAALIQQEAATKQAEEAKAKADKEAKEKAEKLARAKRAGAGLKPAAQSIASTQPGKKLNGSGKTTVRDSIRSALEELRE